MAWWVILLIVLGCIVGAIILLFLLLFLVYITNADSKLLAFVQRKLQKVYDKRKRNRHLE
jgi:formate/nitrite transporter FocA (FNT family)